MKNALSTKKITYILICISILVFLTVGGLGRQYLAGENNVVVSPLADAALNPKYSAFLNGSNYKYTDKNKVEAMHSGVINDDTTEVTVDSSQPHGSQANPYVIDSIDKWTTFAADMTAASGFGNNNYYVLAADLDFSGKNFSQVNNFKGTFYGLGHTLSNINSNKENNNGGVFGVLVDAVITDLNNSDYVFTNVMYNAGGIAGYANGGSILNCHANGVMSRTTQTAQQIITGGILGGSYGKNSSNASAAQDNALIYRCSAVYSANNYDATADSLVGSILGQVWHNGEATILDCYSDITVNSLKAASASKPSYVGMIGICSESGKVRIESSTVKMQVTGMQNSRNGLFGGLFSIWVASGNEVFGPKSFTVKDVYIQAEGERSGTNMTLYPVVTWDECYPRLTKISALSLSNIKYAGRYSMWTKVNSAHNVNFINNDSNVSKMASVDALWAEAKDETASPLKSNIWDKSKINVAYSVADSPVINKLKGGEFKVEFLNHKVSGDEVQAVNGSADFKYNFSQSGLTLPTPIAPDSYHEFVGWTADKSGQSASFKTLPDNIYGDIKLYAVWNIPSSAITAKITARNGTVKQEFNLGSVVLEANVTADCLNANPKIDYKWKKQGDTKIVETKSELTIKEVKDSGEYILAYVIKDSLEPLWSHSDETTSFKGEITPGKLSVRDGTFKLTSAAYVGMLLNEVNFSVTMVNRSGNPISGTASWKSSLEEITKEALSEEGKFATKISFVPDDGNYESGVAYDVDFEADYLKLIFNLTQLNETIEVGLDYNESYSAARIVKMFYEIFEKKVEDKEPGYGSLGEMAPYFDGVLVSDYNTALNNVTQQATIAVTFARAQFTATFDADNGDPIISVGGLFYNKTIPPKDVPAKPVNNGLLFRGWYYDTLDENEQPISVKWDMENDKITDNMTFVGKWLDISKLDLIKLEGEVIKPIEARQALSAGYIKIIATYKGMDAGELLEDFAELTFDDYTVEYEGGDGMVHVLTPKVKIKYTHKTVTKECELTLSVTPIDVDVSMLTFNDKEVEEDGNAHSIDPVQGRLPSSIKSIKYVYRQGGKVVDPSEVISSGIYTVMAEFEMNDPDYAAKPLTATLEILSPAIPVVIEWSSDALTYNGTPQHPIATVKDMDGNIVEVKVNYVGDEAIVVGGNYVVTAEIDINTGYRIKGDATKRFRIDKAILDAPTISADKHIVYTGSELKLEDFLGDTFISAIMTVHGGTATLAGEYKATIELADLVNCEWRGGGNSTTVLVDWTIEKAPLTVKWSDWKFVFKEGQTYAPRVDGFYTGLQDSDKNAVDYDNDFIYTGDTEASAAGSYNIGVAFSGNGAWSDNYELQGELSLDWAVLPKLGMKILRVEWEEPEEGLKYNGAVLHPTFKVFDEKGVDVTDLLKNIIKFGGDYNSSKYAGSYTAEISVDEASGYFILSGKTKPYDIILNDKGEGENPAGKSEGIGSIDDLLSQLGKLPLWQLIASGVSIALALIFFGKGIGYASKCKQAKHTADSKYKTVYAASGLFGLTMTHWTVIASVLMGIAVLGLVFMLIEKSRNTKAQRELEDAKEEFERNKEEAEIRRREDENRRRDEEMKMMFMHMMGGAGANMGSGGAQGAAYTVQSGIGAEEIRGIISETVTALLPGVQQLLPQQATVIQSDDKSAKETNDKLSKIIDLLETYSDRVVEKPIEKIVEKEVRVEVPVEKIVEKEVVKEVKVEVPVEKIVEVPVEVEKIVEKEVPVAAASKAKKEAAPRLTLDEAYEKLSKQQKKFFDGLREYAMKKEKCKEKRSTYNILLGQSTVNPLVKLTIKKDVTVALFKMEDEYLKDIRRNAGSDGTKVKVKETEVAIGDAQAYATAKEMIDLREDQIERYQDFLKEQRALRKR